MILHLTFLDIIDYIGTYAFAVSGIRLAAAKRFDWFGAYVCGLATAVGGGTLRDTMLGLTPFWMSQPSYLIITGLALLTVVIFGKKVIYMRNTMFVFDAIGLALFNIVGIEKTLEAGFPFWVAIIMGTFTGAAGGVIRDVLLNRVPLIFCSELYAIACIIGGLIYYGCVRLGVDITVTQIVAAITVIVVRMLATEYHLALPMLRGSDVEIEDEPTNPDDIKQKPV